MHDRDQQLLVTVVAWALHNEMLRIASHCFASSQTLGLAFTADVVQSK